jgi:hypothetical protein
LGSNFSETSFGRLCDEEKWKIEDIEVKISRIKTVDKYGWQFANGRGCAWRRLAFEDGILEDLDSDKPFARSNEYSLCERRPGRPHSYTADCDDDSEGEYDTAEESLTTAVPAVLRIVRNCYPNKCLTRGTILSLPRRFSEVLLLDAGFVPHPWVLMSHDFVYLVTAACRSVFSHRLYNAQFTKFVKLLKPRTVLFALQGIAAGVSV